MKTAISVPDDVFREAERFAKELGVSRSELFTRAVRAYLEQRASEELRASYDEAFGEGDEDHALRRRAARRVLEGVEW